MESDPITAAESIVRHAQADAAWQGFEDALGKLVPDASDRDVLEDLAITALMFHELAVSPPVETVETDETDETRMIDAIVSGKIPATRENLLALGWQGEAIVNLFEKQGRPLD
jgi:hypothetical protein